MSAALTLLLFSATAYFLNSFLRSKKFERYTWQELLDMVVQLDPELLADLLSLQEDGNEQAFRDLLARLGGMSALKVIETNAEAMLGLAMYAERWDDCNGPVFSELMRRDALKLKRAVYRLRLSWVLGSRVSLNAGLELSQSYGDLRERVLAIYETVHTGLLPQLQAVV